MPISSSMGVSNFCEVTFSSARKPSDPAKKREQLESARTLVNRALGRYAGSSYEARLREREWRDRHEALASVGTSRVARLMATFATRRHEARWADALDVIYRCLEKVDDEDSARRLECGIAVYQEPQLPFG